MSNNDISELASPHSTQVEGDSSDGWQQEPSDA
jgi:hypothetical protein